MNKQICIFANTYDNLIDNNVDRFCKYASICHLAMHSYVTPTSPSLFPPNDSSPSLFPSHDPSPSLFPSHDPSPFGEAPTNPDLVSLVEEAQGRRQPLPAGRVCQFLQRHPGCKLGHEGAHRDQQHREDHT